MFMAIIQCTKYSFKSIKLPCITHVKSPRIKFWVNSCPKHRLHFSSHPGCIKVCRYHMLHISRSFEKEFAVDIGMLIKSPRLRVAFPEIYKLTFDFILVSFQVLLRLR